MISLDWNKCVQAKFPINLQQQKITDNGGAKEDRDVNIQEVIFSKLNPHSLEGNSLTNRILRV